ncbi:DUF4351 domain-containing protein [Clostridium hydrogeniformans]|uniref:DUF4351 domain-containing protein n=1 Tax=Clostridium hydrogeniformans TaxID=349933 RepID=UPI000480B4BE|nr:DUF4351 domain-containing protein [Clostridium hydrogeniformans]
MGFDLSGIGNIVNNLKEKGIDGIKEQVVNALTDKFGVLPKDMVTQVMDLGVDQLEKLLKNIPAIGSLEDLKKYLP